MNSRDYWKAREETQRQKNIAQEAEYSRRIQDIYTKMYQNIQDDINSFYVKYADAEGITLAEAKKRISKLDIDEYAAKAKRYVEQAAKDRAANHGKTDRTAAYFSDQANAEMRLYNATMKINRLELLKAHLGLEMIEGHDELEKLFGDALSQRTLDEFKRQAGILGGTVLNNEKLAHSIVNASFHNAEFSDRVWMAQDLMKYRLHEMLTQALIKGLNPKALTRELMPLIKKEILENKRAAAERLLRTELCRVQIDAQMKSYERNGYDRYIFLAEPTACPHCRKLDDQDFAVKDAMPGENAPPLHPNCRCSTAAYYEEWRDKFVAGDRVKQLPTDDNLSDKNVDTNTRRAPVKLLNSDADGDKIYSWRVLLEEIKPHGIYRLPVKDNETDLTEEEIIKKIAGKDKTEGSCASVALAYIGNKLGLDVRDYRGGGSQAFFSDRPHMARLCSIADGKTAISRDDFRAAYALLRTMEPGREYCLTVGEHTAIVRRTKHGKEYLELQHSAGNGFRRLTKTELSHRFKCKTKPIPDVEVTERCNYLFEIDKLADYREDFKALLEYLNTAEIGEKKELK